MGEHVDRLVVKLAKVFVPPHPSMTPEGKPFMVEGYWRRGGAGVPEAPTKSDKKPAVKRAKKFPPRRVRFDLITEETEHEGDIEDYIRMDRLPERAAKHGVKILGYQALEDVLDDDGEARRYEQGHIMMEAPSAEAMRSFVADIRNKPLTNTHGDPNPEQYDAGDPRGVRYVDPPSSIKTRVVKSLTREDFAPGKAGYDEYIRSGAAYEMERREVLVDGEVIGAIRHYRGPLVPGRGRQIDWRVDTRDSEVRHGYSNAYRGQINFDAPDAAAKALAGGIQPRYREV